MVPLRPPNDRAERAGHGAALVAEVGVLGVSLDTDDHARTRGELVVVADLTTADEAFEVVAAVRTRDDPG